MQPLVAGFAVVIFVEAISAEDRTSLLIKTAVSFVAVIVFFFNSLFGLCIGTLTTILPITHIWITGRITISNTRTLRPRMCNQQPPDPPAVTRLLLSSIQAIRGPSIRAPIQDTSLAPTVRPR